MIKKQPKSLLLAAIVYALAIGVPIYANAQAQAVAPACARLLSDDAQNLKGAFLGQVTKIQSEQGSLDIGIVDVDYPGVAESISDLLIRSITDAKESNAKPGHLPDHLVDDVIRQYITPEKVKSFWRFHGHRFAAMNAKGEIVGTLLLGIDKDTILYLNRWTNNVPSANYPDIKPNGYHQMMNLSVRHELRRSKIASLLIDTVTKNFRHLFNGKGIWMRADPPWHDKLMGLGFHHDLSMDSFLHEGSEQTLGLPNAKFNEKYRCACHSDNVENSQSLLVREQKMAKQKLQYFSFTRDFDATITSEKKIDQSVDVLIFGAGIAGTSMALKLREMNPDLKILIVSKDSKSAISGQGHLYPMSNMQNFRFLGKNSVQPEQINGVVYPGEVERALVANLQNLHVYTNENFRELLPDGTVLLKSGSKIHAKAVVVATGVSEISNEIIDASAQGKTKDFVSFYRDLAQTPYIKTTTGQFGKIAVLGDGAAAQAMVNQLEKLKGNVVKSYIQIGKKMNGENVKKVSYENNHFRIDVFDKNGELKTYFADQVVTALGFSNTESEHLARKLNTNWLIGAGAHANSAPSIADQSKTISQMAEQLNKHLTQPEQQSATFNPLIEGRRFIYFEDWARAKASGFKKPYLYYGVSVWSDWADGAQYVQQLAKSAKSEISVENLKEIHKRTTRTYFFRWAEDRRIDQAFRDGKINSETHSALKKILYVDKSDDIYFSGVNHQNFRGTFRTDSVDNIKLYSAHLLSDGTQWWAASRLNDFRRNPLITVNEASIREIEPGKFTADIELVESKYVDALTEKSIKAANEKLITAKSREEVVTIAAVLLKELMSIHPFQDGNGRAIRLFIDLIYLKHGLPTPYLMREREISDSIESMVEFILKGMNVREAERSATRLVL